MSEVIVITSGKGGVGKTTTTANVGTGLAKLDQKVVLIDTDIGLRNLDVVMGLENRIVYNLVDVVEGNCRIKQALIKDKRYPNLYLLPSAQTRDKTAVSPEQMVKLIEELRSEFDYILLDCPAGMVSSRNPQCCITLHSLVTDQNILKSIVQCMSHVQLTGNIWRRHHNSKRFFASVHFCVKIFSSHPFGIGPILNAGRIISLCKFFHNLSPCFLSIL